MRELKCETCGATLSLNSECTIATCSVCGNVYEYKSPLDDYYIEQLKEAHDLRANMDFDDAEKKYRYIEKEYKNAEVYWGLLLARYGISYEQDPLTHVYVPTFHRNKRQNILEDDAYIEAINTATEKQSERYRIAGKDLRRIQESIEEYARTHEGFEVFISFKATDIGAHGMPQKTIDRDIAYNIYDELSSHGVKTFFSEVTLRDRASSDYEAVIFNALSTCKVFILVGTSLENINSTWVKNEWSRYTERLLEDKKYGEAQSSHFAVVGGSLTVDALPPIFGRTQNVMLSGYAGDSYKKDIASSVYKLIDREPIYGSIEDNADLKPTENLVYALNDDFNSYSIDGCTRISGDSIIIPASHKGLAVTRIADGAFKYNRGVKAIKLPNTIEYIGKEAFYGSDVVSINLPSHLKKIGDHAFETSDKLEHIVIPRSVEEIGEWAFLRCTALESLKVEDGSRLSLIGKGAFESCIHLRSIYFPHNIEIPRCSIWGSCVCISEVIAPASVAVGIPRNSLKTVTINGGECVEKHAFENANNLRSVTILEGVKRIGASAFSSADKLAEVHLPESLVAIDEGAFYGCSALREIHLGSNLMSIGKFAFTGCMRLERVNVPISVTTMGELAFNCNKNCIVSVEATEVPRGWHKNWKSDKLFGRRKNVIFGAKE